MNTISSIDRTLLLGARSNDVAAVKQAVSKGADIYYRNGEVIEFGIKTGNPEMLRALLDAGYNLDYRDEIVFHWVIKAGSAEMFEMLCEVSAPPVWSAGAIKAAGNEKMIALFTNKTGLSLA